MRRFLSGVCLASAILGIGTPALAQGRPQPTRVLTVMVVDQMGAAIVGARITVTSVSGMPPTEMRSDGRGEAQFPVTGPVALRVEADGFMPYVVADLPLRSARVRHVARLRLAGYVEDIVVRRDPRTSRTDRRGDGFSTILGPEDLADLPDDPDMLREWLAKLAGPGVRFRIDGFGSGRFPTKAEIARVRIAWNTFGAEFHEAGGPVVDITTRPGSDQFHAALGAGYLPSALAGTPVQPHAGAPGTATRFSAMVGGPLVRERSTILAIAQYQRQSEPITFARPEALASPNSPGDRSSEHAQLVSRFGQALGHGWNLRGAAEFGAQRQDHLGIGGLSWPERAFSRRQRTWSASATASGGVTAGLFNEARLRVEGLRSRATAASEAPAVLVAGLGQFGGAQVEGGRRTFGLEFGDDLDLAWRQHAVRLGVLIEHQRLRSDEWQNRGGTFLFTSLAAFEAARPATFVRRTGDPLVAASSTRLGVYLQDDVRVSPGVSLSAGVRIEAQRRIGSGLNVSPRVAGMWSPLSGGQLTMMAGFGVYHGWLDLQHLETVTRIDGIRQREELLLDPTYPDAVAGVAGTLPPSNRYVLDPDLRLPRRLEGQYSLQWQPTNGIVLRASVEGGRTSHVFRGRNLNPLSGGTARPDSRFGNVVQLESTSRESRRLLRTSATGRLPRVPVTLMLNYTLGRVFNDTDGAFDLPADQSHPEAEWGPSSFNARHQFNGFALVTVRQRLFAAVNVGWQSALPYTVTTGYDDNGDSVFNDRPAGVGRNSRWQTSQWQSNARITWSWSVGSSPTTPGGPAGGAERAPRETPRARLRIHLDVRNPFNRQDGSQFVGVLASPLFGQPTAFASPRAVEFGATIDF